MFGGCRFSASPACPCTAEAPRDSEPNFPTLILNHRQNSRHDSDKNLYPLKEEEVEDRADACGLEEPQVTRDFLAG